MIYIILFISLILSIIALIIASLAFNKSKKRESYNDNYKVKDAKGDIIELSPKWTHKEWDNLRKGQKIMTKMFKEFDKICRKYGLKYWAIGGTLIGAVRHNGWVPWDGDVDVVMESKDVDKLVEIIDDELSDDYFFIDAKNPTNDKYYEESGSNTNKIRYKHAWYSNDDPKKWHHGLQLDIFVLKKYGEVVPNIQGKQNNIYKTKEISEVIHPLKELVFEDFKIFVPNKCDKYLESWLGKSIPPLLQIKDRIPHEGKISFKIPKIWKEKMYKYLY